MMNITDHTSGPHPESGEPVSPPSTEFVPASALRRLVAFLIDLVPMVILQLASGGGRWGFALIFSVYHTVSVAVFGRTLGKAATALKVQRPDGSRLGWLLALLRSTVGYFASSFILLGFLHIFRDARGRGWHDVLFGSEVVQQPGTLTVKQLIRATDDWTEQLDAWLNRMLARYNRLEKLFSLVLKLTGLVTLLRGWVEQFVGWILGHIKGTAAAAPQAPTGAAATATGATATAAGTGALTTVTSTVTALVLTGATVITYQAVVPRPTTNPYQGIPEAALGSKLNNPSDIVVSSDGSVYIIDTESHRIRRVGPDGIITTVAGSGPTGEHKGGFAGDGGKATKARLNLPRGVVLAPDGSLYIADTQNRRIRRVKPNGVITTIAGGGTAGLGDGGPATKAQLRYPYAIALGPDDNLYIADTWNHRIRRVGPDGVITTVAGAGEKGFSGDGRPALQAKLNSPDGIAIARDGSLFIADTGNFRVRRVTPDGIITTVAGGGTNGFGDGGPATLARLDYVQRGQATGMGLYRGTTPPSGLVLGPDGSLYITDANDRIRRIKPDGIISTVAGGGSDRPGDGEAATEAKLIWPAGLAVGSDGSLYIADFAENLIRRVSDGIITTTWPVVVPETATILEEDFNAENSGIGTFNYFRFANWDVKQGSVDLIGNGFHDLFPGRGLYVDLDGTTGDAAKLGSQNIFLLKPGKYRLEFELAGSQRGDTNTVTVTLTNMFKESFTLDSSAPFRTIERTISVSAPTTGKLSFDHAGGDNSGLLLDNVKLTKVE